MDPDAIPDLRATYGYENAEHVYRYNEDGWVIDFFPIPKSPKLRGQPGVRPLGRFMDEPKEFNLENPLRSAILAKAGRYGKLELPLIVAVNAFDMKFNHIDYASALLGTEGWYIGPAGKRIMERDTNGAFFAQYGPRLSAVAFFNNIRWDNFPGSEALLVHNYVANLPLSSELDRLTHIREGQHKAGVTLSEVFGLPTFWPLDEVIGDIFDVSEGSPLDDLDVDNNDI